MGLALAGLMITAAPASAGEGYCREYVAKSFSIGGKRQEGYGTACYRPDGSWEIVDLKGNDNAQDEVREYIRDDLYRRDDRVIIVDRYEPVRYERPYYAAPRWPVYYNRHHSWRDNDWCDEHERRHRHNHRYSYNNHR